MSHPSITEFNGVVYQAEHNAGSHVLRRYLASDGTELPFKDGTSVTTILDETLDQRCGLTVHGRTGVLVADIPTADGIVTRQSDWCGEPGTWKTVG